MTAQAHLYKLCLVVFLPVDTKVDPKDLIIKGEPESKPKRGEPRYFLGVSKVMFAEGAHSVTYKDFKERAKAIDKRFSHLSLRDKETAFWAWVDSHTNIPYTDNSERVSLKQLCYQDVSILM